MAVVVWLLAAPTVLPTMLPTAHAGPLSAAGASRTDLAMVNRIAWGLDVADAEQLRQSGFDAWLEQQLSPPQTDDLLERIRQHIAALSISRGNLTERLAERRALQQQLRAMIDPDQQAALKQSINRQNQTHAQEATERRILRAVYSRQQLREVLTWFWFNHLNVFAHKGCLRTKGKSLCCLPITKIRPSGHMCSVTL